MHQSLSQAYEKASGEVYRALLRNLDLKVSQASSYENVVVPYFVRASEIVRKVRANETLTAREVTFLNLVIK